MDEILTVKKLKVNYYKDEKRIEALNFVDLEIKKGEALGIVGETGAGKTTLALTIMGLIEYLNSEVENGEIYLENENILRMDEKKKERIRGKDIAMIFQDPMTSLNPVLTIIDQVAEVFEIHDGVKYKEAKEKAKEILKKVGIPENRVEEYPHQFSGGMKQRVVIAMALAYKPKILIADEPTTALDVTIQAQVLDLIYQLQKEFEMSLILISHDLGVVGQICDRVAVMYAGEIIEIGDVESIFENPKHPYTKGLFDAIPKMNEEVKRLKVIEGEMPDPTKLPKGCKFFNRCKKRINSCKIEYTTYGEEHKVKCNLYKRSDGKL